MDEMDLARRYAQHVAPTFVTVARRALDLAGVESGNTVLDLGTATGIGAFFAAERAGRDGSVIGLDPSGAMLELARERSTAVGYDYIRWQQGEPAPLTYADESFDAVLCLQALHTFANPFAVLEEVRRVLVEGGRLALTLWSTRAANDWMGLVDHALRHGAPGVPPPGTLPLSQPGNVEALLQAAGFEEVEAARALDRMRFHGVDAFWEYVRALPHWGVVLDSLTPERRAGVQARLTETLAPFTREEEIAIGRELLYVRAVAPEAD